MQFGSCLCLGALQTRPRCCCPFLPGTPGGQRGARRAGGRAGRPGSAGAGAAAAAAAAGRLAGGRRRHGAPRQRRVRRPSGPGVSAGQAPAAAAAAHAEDRTLPPLAGWPPRRPTFLVCTLTPGYLLALWLPICMCFSSPLRVRSQPACALLLTPPIRLVGTACADWQVHEGACEQAVGSGGRERWEGWERRRWLWRGSQGLYSAWRVLAGTGSAPRARQRSVDVHGTECRLRPAPRPPPLSLHPKCYSHVF